MTQPDPATGLPQLPEGQWWEVAEAEVHVFNRYGGPGHERKGFEVRICTAREVPSIAIYDREPKPRKHWWSRQEWIDVPRKHDTVPAIIDKAVVYNGSKDYRTRQPAYQLAPRLIRIAAYGIVQRRNRQARSDALLGKYPPNTLPAK